MELQRTRGLSRRSLREHKEHVDSLRLFCRGRGIRFVEELTPGLFKDFLDIHAYKGAIHLKLVVWSMRAFGQYLAVMQLLDADPAAGLSHPILRRRTKLPPYLRPNEFSAFMTSAFDQHTDAECIVIMLMVSLGLRPREVTALRPQDVNPLREVIAVTVKGGWLRLLPMSHELSEMFTEYLQQEGITRQGPLFVNQWNRPVDVRWIQRLVRDVAREAGLRRPISPRILRHTFATYMADRHGKEAARMFLGHGAAGSTNTYLHLAPTRRRRFMEMHPFATPVHEEPHDHHI